VTKPAVETASTPLVEADQAPDAPPEWATGASPPRQPAAPETIARARGGIQPTRTGPATPESSDPADDPDADADRDDADADDSGLQGAELLQRELGATVIEEIPHE
jgi:DNA polymerase-3 subunit gamma/tau